MVLHVVADAGKSCAERPEYIAPIVCEQISRKPGKLAQDAVGKAADVLIARCKIGSIHELRRRVRVAVLGHRSFLAAVALRDVFFGGLPNKGELPRIQSAVPIDRLWLASRCLELPRC